MDKPIPEAVMRAVAEWEQCMSPLAAQAAMFKIANDLRANEAERALTAAQQQGQPTQQGGGEVPESVEFWAARLEMLADTHGCGSATMRESARLLRELASAPPSAPDRDAYEGAREDLLDWKGRAQRAEATLRGLGYKGIDASEAPSAPVGVDLSKLQRHVWSSRGWEPDPKGPLVQFKDIEALVQQPAAVDEKCPKCNRRSGDNWKQCEGACPMPQSPHHAALAQQPAAVEGLPSNAMIDRLETKDALRALCKSLRNALAQQPATVDEATVKQRAREVLAALTPIGINESFASFAFRAIEAALATQHQEPTT